MESLVKSSLRPVWVIVTQWTVIMIVLGSFAVAILPITTKPQVRTRATPVLQELRAIDAAIDQYAIEAAKQGGATVKWEDVRNYLKAGTKSNPPQNRVE